MPTLINLKVNRDYIEPDFPGYKLSLETLPSFTLKLSKQVFIRTPSNDQYSYKHAKLFSQSNHLFGINCNELEETQHLYYSGNDSTVYKVKLDILGFEEQTTNWSIPKSEKHNETSPYNISLKFPRNNLAVLADGTGNIYFIDTNDEWKTIHQDVFAHSFVILDCKVIENAIHVALFNIKTTNDGKTFSAIAWVSYKLNNEKWERVFAVESEANAEVNGGFFSNDCQLYYLFCNNGNFGITDEKNASSVKYSWAQTNDTVTVYIKCNNAKVDTKNKFLKVVDKASGECLEGEFYSEIDPAMTTWNTRDGILEILLFKKVEFMWPALLIGQSSNFGTYLQDEQAIADIHLKLSHLCSSEEAQEVPTKVASITDQMEDCDFSSSNNVLECLQINDSNQLQKLHEVQINNEVVICNSQDFGLHQNEDICMYRLKGDQPCNFEHYGSLFAIGYIRASKQRRKFTVSAPDLSFCAIVECSRHIFLYRQNVSVASGELRNRNSGKMYKQLAQQHVIELPTNEDIVGVQVSNTTLFVLTVGNIFAFRIN